MKNYLNCHCVGLHSFPISLDENGLYKRIFYADTNHELWKPNIIAIHPHHVSIRINVLKGELINYIYEESLAGFFYGKYKWDSHIKSGNGGFKFIEHAILRQVSIKRYKAGEEVWMDANELHTVYVKEGEVCVWQINEYQPIKKPQPVSYSTKDLSNWNSEGLYIEVGEEIKQKYVGEFIK